MEDAELDRPRDLTHLEALLNPVLPPANNEADTTLTIRLPASLKVTLKSEAEARGINLSDYVRLKLSGAALPMRRRRQPIHWLERSVLIELNRIGINLNQSVRKLNSQEHPRENTADRQMLTQILEALQNVELALLCPRNETDDNS
ncbi:hypothetical protein IQ268_28255 [Oculatella sp. LEGE 06141]|uniref:hypothetical protein n=1 Tax=Oculatella sp. LEGE 06141 TaxID=1828648 RepID=UPI001881B760|nr:hypothetical protein [Oculatella sp. LEGE 06141]MBE9182446.1 hypothetical protein [Oculatella sp. LEGE 06141]